MKTVGASGVLLFLLSTILISGCDSVSLKEDSQHVEFELAGGVVADFSEGDAEFTGSVRFSRTGISNRLDVLLRARCKSEARHDEAQLSFRFAYASNSGELPPGEYSVVPDEFVTSIGDGFYRLTVDGNHYAMYGFDGTSLRMEVAESEPGRLKARFSYVMEQRTGERFEDGQSIVVTLAAPVSAQGKFDLPIEGLEFPLGD